jgi:sporulation protein YlmC with PRC-barrel domain
VTNEERLRELEEKYEGYKVYDNAGERIGKVDDLFVDDANREEYIGVKTGFFGLKSTLIPMDIVRVNEQERTIEVSESKDRVKDAPNFDDDQDITAELEDRIRKHFGVGSSGPTVERGAYRRYSETGTSEAETGAATETGTSQGSYRDTSDRHSDEPVDLIEGSTVDDHEEPDSEGSGEGTREDAVGYRAGDSERLGYDTGIREQGGGRTRVRRRILREEDEEIIEEYPERRE